jgi:N-acetylglutamate synthase-like GNAT family acetyltransferase
MTVTTTYETPRMICQCTHRDFNAILEIINDAARAYQGAIPADRWHDPYMSGRHLREEIEDGVNFWGWAEEGKLIGVMGMQDKGDVVLIRHAYVRTVLRNRGIGSRLLQYLESATDKPILIGTWAAALWAISFYERNGYRLVAEEEKNRLLKKYWTIPERQIETSVVLADTKHPQPGLIFPLKIVVLK